MEIGLSLGSNLGNCAMNIANARSQISDIKGVRIIANSPLYKTEPVDVPREFSTLHFVNTITIIETSIAPDHLLKHLAAIEKTLGRNKNYGIRAPRPIDIDIIYADQISLSTADLTIPHPRWSARRFVVQPLADVRPDLWLPGSSQTIEEILLSLPSEPKVILYSET